MPGKVTVPFEKGGTTVVIKDVPALVCPVCGAWYLDEATTDQVLQLGNAAASSGVEVGVVRLKAA
jgi:YgiT-type zinc finger domain-containing protein